MSETEIPLVPRRLLPYLKEIAERLSSGHAAVMVGAGFSRNAKPNGGSELSFPDWSELGDQFYEKLNGKKPNSASRYPYIDTEVQDIPESLWVRQQAACLAYQLSKYYTKQGNSIPEEIREWKTICQSENEFAEIRNQWHDLEEKVHDN